VRVLPRSPVIVVLAVVLACMLWYANALDRRERISERQLDTAVTLVNVPPDMVITSEVPRLLSLRVRGPLSRLRSLDPGQTGVVIDLRGAGEGQRDFAVETRNVVVPAGVEVLAISPSQVPLRLERLGRRSVPVKARVVGDPAPGLAVRGVQVDPPSVVLSGPRLQLEALGSITTEPVNVDGADGPVEALAAVRSPNPLIRVVQPPTVRVVIQIGAAPAEVRGGRRR
jgi:YbbR domain-containing protein